jgi:putative ABC transport system ATP-binding protein
MYRLAGAAKVFQQGPAIIHAVDNVDLSIDEGEFLAIEGPSGSGKSSLLQLLGALDRATHGLVEFEGADLGTLDDRALARLRLETFGFVFQQFNLIPTLTAQENVEVALAPLGWGRKKMRTRAEKVLTAVGLQGRLDHLPTQLSGGEQQRVAIARALSCQPRVLLADEPTGNLDSRTGAEIVDLLRELAENLGQTLIVITHDERIAALAPRVVRIRDGQIAADLRGDQIAEAPPMPARLADTQVRVAPEPVAPVAAGKGADWVPTDAMPEDERPVILQAEGVRKVYRTSANEVVALPNLSFGVHEGEFVAVTGPSGSGKTTLLNCLSGLDRIDGGRALIDGQAIHELQDKERSRLRATTLGFIFQTWNLIPVFSAVENVELPLLLGGVRTADARRQAIYTLERVGLGHRLEHRPNELSGGEQQRVAIARALAAGPRLVWADEPTGNLDSETAAAVMRLLRELNRDGLTVVLVTHEEGIAETATRRLRMRDGVVISDHTRVGPAAVVGPVRAEPAPVPAAPKPNRKQRKAAERAAALAAEAERTEQMPAVPPTPAAPEPEAGPAAVPTPPAPPKPEPVRAAPRPEPPRPSRPEVPAAAASHVPTPPSEQWREPEPIHDYETVHSPAPRPTPRPDPPRFAPRPDPPRSAPRPEPARPAPRPEPARPAPRPEPARLPPRPEPLRPAPRPEPPSPAPRPEPPSPERVPKFIAPDPVMDPPASRPEPEPAPQALEPEPEPAPQETEPMSGADPLVSLPPVPPPPPPAATPVRSVPDGWGEPEWVDLTESEITS